MGKTSFLRILEAQLKKYKELPPTVFCDLNNLSPVTEEAALKYFLERVGIELKKEVKSFEEFKAVFIVDRFEKACQLLPATFFDKLYYTRKQTKRETVFILSSDRELSKIRSYEDIGQFYSPIAALTYYLKPFNKREADYYIETYAKERDLHLKEEEISEIYKLTGGHARMINAYILYLTTSSYKDLKTGIKEANNSDAVNFQCRRIYDYFTDPEKRALQRLAKGLAIEETGKESFAYLKKLGVIDEQNKIFSKRFEEYIKEVAPEGKVPIYLDEITGEIFKYGKRIDQELSAQEYKFLKHLMENPDKIVSRDELIEVAWGVKGEEGVSDEAVDQLVSRLRDKVEDNPSEPKHIITIRGRGFQFKMS